MLAAASIQDGAAGPVQSSGKIICRYLLLSVGLAA